MSPLLAIDESHPGLSYALAEAVRNQQLSARTIQTYQHWITQYLAYFEMKNPKTLSEKNVKEFLRYLIKSMSLSRARLNQAREALLFFYDRVLKKPLRVREIEAH